MDTTWFRDINRFAVRTGWLHPFMKFYAVYGVALFAVMVLTAWWYARYSRNASKAVAAAFWAAAGTLVAYGLNQFIVHAAQRRRPFEALRGVEVLVAKTKDYSFPSDHAVIAGAATTGLWIVAYYGPKIIRQLAYLSTVLAVLLAFARVYVGVHYPGDVVAGLAVGAVIVLIGWLLLGGVLTAFTGAIARHGPLRPMIVARHRTWRRWQLR
jgi:membrane-associated phospholipid phosphatase